jgi:ATP-independent RNA helicase DbpA
MDTLRVSGGRKDKLRPGDILGALTGEAGGLLGDDVGKIEIHDRFAFVAIKKGVSQRALSSPRRGRVAGVFTRPSTRRGGALVLEVDFARNRP